MAEVSVKQLATDIDTPVDRLLQQFVDAGISKSKADDMVSESEKQTLLAHLKKQHGGDEVAAPARMTLQRKTKSTISVQGTGGKNKEVQVEVRKSRTYVRRSALEDEQRQAEAEETARLEAEEKARREAEEKARLDAEEKARREAEQARREAEEKARIEAQQKGSTGSTARQSSR
ncbi:translation initiation factor IF-2 associated domain-containing protein [Aeromonas hydrophila]|uniref:Translation initiation factor IF-2 associated domain-containing protein n=1 Tax=Aeromonas hydrophila TaxID=644 RepID=A0A926ITJ4_AERHY|nr:translation initiation factor IF-2 associated domain-containing protein [Aeromonas hydrophila]